MSQQAAQSDKRKFKRFAFDSPVVIEKDGQQWKSSLLDISLKGVLLVRPDNWESNSEEKIFKLTILLDNTDNEIKMDAYLAHTFNNNLGFRCEKIGLDSVTNLRRLVELNLANEGLLEREISNIIMA